MDRKQTEDVVARLATPCLEHTGLSLWGVEFFPGAGRSLLRVYIEGDEGVDVEDCARVSRHLGVALEVEDFIPGAFTLEVSSPGLTRSFFSPGQLAGYLGREIDIVLNAPREGRKHFAGPLAGIADDRVNLLVDGQSLAFDWNEIKKAKLVHDFSTPAQLDKGCAKTAPPRTGGKK